MERGKIDGGINRQKIKAEGKVELYKECKKKAE